MTVVIIVFVIAWSPSGLSRYRDQTVVNTLTIVRSLRAIATAIGLWSANLIIYNTNKVACWHVCNRRRNNVFVFLLTIHGSKTYGVSFAARTTYEQIVTCNK